MKFMLRILMPLLWAHTSNAYFTVDNEKHYITALYFTDWSYPGSAPLDIPLSHVTNIFFAFGGLNTHEYNIFWTNHSADVSNRINLDLSTLIDDCNDLKNLSISENVNAEMYRNITWLDDYLSNANKFINSYTKDVNRRKSQGLMGQLHQLKTINPRLKISLSLGGDGSGARFKSITKSKIAIKKFVANVAANLEAFGFDGIDIDWEFPETHKEKKYMLYLVEKFSQRFAKMEPDASKRKIISIALPLDLDTLEFYDLQNLDPYVSYYNLMGYDISGKWSTQSGYQSQLYPDPNVTGSTISVDTAVKYLSGYVDKSKILLGMPAYGRTFNTDKLYSKFTDCATLNRSLEHYSDNDPEDCMIQYIYLPPPGYTEVSNTEIGAAYAYISDDEEDKGIIVYDTPEIARLKARYVVDNGLGGGMWWDSHGDHLIKNTSRSLVYNFISELGGIYMLNDNIAQGGNGNDGQTDIVSVHMLNSDFASNSGRRYTLGRLFWVFMASSILLL